MRSFPDYLTILFTVLPAMVVSRVTVSIKTEGLHYTSAMRN